MELYKNLPESEKQTSRHLDIKNFNEYDKQLEKKEIKAVNSKLDVYKRRDET
jgi:hypothetical protein